MSNSINTFVWYELLSTDVAAAKSFYGSVIGWHANDVPMPGMTYTLLSTGDRQVGGMMTIPPQMAEAGMKPFWTAHIGVEDVDAAAARLKQLGGSILRPPTDIAGVGRFSAAADPQGARFCLFQPSQPGERKISREPGQIGWHELHTKDWPSALAFYRAMFGWIPAEGVDMGPMGTYQLFTIAGSAAGGMFNSEAARPECFWLYYFNVEDIDAAAKLVGAGGGSIMQGPHQVPGGDWIVQAKDPQGAAFALLGMRR